MSAQAWLEALASCLCAQVGVDGLPAFCFCGLVPGEVAAADFVGECSEGVCGMGWVRLVAAYPAVSVGNPDENPSNCDKPLGLDVEMGVLRCAAMPDDLGNPPTEAEMLADTTLQVADLEMMRRAMLCCLDSKDFLLGAYTPIGPQGGVVGGFWTLSLLDL